MMRILLTGGAGFIGRHVHAALVASGHEVRVLDSLRSDVHRARTVPVPDLRVGDVRDPDALDAALRGVDLVVHLAAKVGLGVHIHDLPDYADSNVHGTAALLAGMVRADVGALVQASSMVVYGEGLGSCVVDGSVAPGPRAEHALRAGRFESPCPRCSRPLQPLLVGEDAPTDPLNGYAVTKLAQEQLASIWARATGGQVTSLRLHNVYGPGLPRDTPYAGVAAIFLSSLRRGHAPRVFEDGGQRRDFVHVGDVASAFASAVAEPAHGVRVLNIGSGTVRTIGDLASALARASQSEGPVVTGEYRLGDVRHITADSSRARTELGWRPEVDFEAGVAELVDA